MDRQKYSLLLKNTLWGSGSFVLISLFSFLLLPYIVKKLTIEGYGIYVLITSMVGFYGILDLGLGNALIKYVAEYYEKKDLIKLNNYINSTIIFQGIIGILSSMAILVYSKNILHILNVSQENFVEATYALNLCAIGFFFTFIGGAYRSVLQGLQLFQYTSVMDTLINLALNLFVALILFMGYGLIGSIIINVLVAIMTFAGYYVLVKQNIPSYKVNLFINIKILKEIIHFSFYIFLSKISTLFSNYIVRFVISYFLGPSAVTYYTVPSKLVNAVGGIASSGLSAIFPFSSQLSTTNDQLEIKKLFLKSSRIFIAVVFPISLFITLFSMQILTVWMGAEFASKTWIVLSIIAFSSFLGGLSTIPNLIILGQGNSRLIGLFSFLTIILYMIFLPLLTNFFGIIGTSFALLIATIGVIYYVILKTTQFNKINILEYFNEVLKPHIVIFIVAILLFPFIIFMKSQLSILIFVVGCLLMGVHYFYLIKLKVIPIENIYNNLVKRA